MENNSATIRNISNGVLIIRDEDTAYFPNLEKGVFFITLLLSHSRVSWSFEQLLAGMKENPNVAPKDIIIFLENN